MTSEKESLKAARYQILGALSDGPDASSREEVERLKTALTALLQTETSPGAGGIALALVTIEARLKELEA